MLLTNILTLCGFNSAPLLIAHRPRPATGEDLRSTLSFKKLQKDLRWIRVHLEEDGLWRH